MEVKSQNCPQKQERINSINVMVSTSPNIDIRHESSCPVQPSVSSLLHHSTEYLLVVAFISTLTVVV